MKRQIARFSPHQNGKVLAILFALMSVIFLVPLILVSLMLAPPGIHRPSIWLVVVMPLFYSVVSYVGVAAACLIYNGIFKLVGGIEYEFEGKQT